MLNFYENLNIIALTGGNISVEKFELKNILHLVIGVAINCKRKKEFIQMIMYMNEYVQTQLMIAIEEVITDFCLVITFKFNIKFKS